MGRATRPEAPDGLAPLLRDPDDQVRIAATQALSRHCSDRGEAYLRMAFTRSDAAVRAQIIESLKACGKTPEETLAKEEAERRRKAMKLLDEPVAAQRARGAHELGLLCREQDQHPLLALLDNRDGVAVAAAARALGDCGVPAAVPKLVKLLDEGGEIGAAAAEALMALHATDAAKPRIAQAGHGRWRRGHSGGARAWPGLRHGRESEVAQGRRGAARWLPPARRCPHPPAASG